MQWDGTNWVLVDETALNITEADAIIGNEVTNATDGTLQLNGTGTDIDPLTLDVAPLGIDTPELADDAVTTDKILDANVTPGKIAPGTNGQVLTTIGGVTSWENSLTSVVGVTGQVAAADGTAGAYTINDPSIETTSIIQLTVVDATSPTIIQLTNQADETFSVQIYTFSGGTFTETNANWQYIVVNP